MEDEIILSIHPEFVKKIIDGTKKYEYRRRIPKKDITKIYIYETCPTKKIIGEVRVAEIIKEEPSNLWKLTKQQSGIKKKFFDEYFKGLSIAYAYKIDDLLIYDKPRDLSDYGLKQAPQSYAYVR